MQVIDEVGFDLHQCGLTLQLTPGRLRALFRTAPSILSFIFDEPLDIGKWRTEASNREVAIARDPESTDDDWNNAVELGKKAKEDYAARQMAFFIADVLMGWLLISPVDSAEDRLVENAMQKFVDLCFLKDKYEKVLGDALSDAIAVVIDRPTLTLRFIRAGGLPLLFSEWVCICIHSV